MDLVLLPQVLFVLEVSVFSPPRPFNPLPLSHSSGHSSTGTILRPPFRLIWLVWAPVLLYLSRLLAGLWALIAEDYSLHSLIKNPWTKEELLYTMREPFSFLTIFPRLPPGIVYARWYRSIGSQAPSSHLLMKRTTNMDPPRSLVAASTSSYVRTDLFGIDETLKLDVVTATLSPNDPRGELLDRRSVIFRLG